MAGRGTRTSDLGLFKPFIPVNGGSILEWLLLSLSVHVTESSRFVFVTTQDFEREFQVEETIGRSLARCGIQAPFEVVLAPDVPQGPAKSVAFAVEALRGVLGMVTVVNVDQYVHFEIPAGVGMSPDDGDSGFMPLYAEFTSKASYAQIEAGRITRVVEKENISNLASAGVYGLSSVTLLDHMLQTHFASGETVKGEYYVGPAYNHLIRDGVPVYPAGTLAKFDLGNLSGIDGFRHRLRHNSCRFDPEKKPVVF